MKPATHLSPIKRACDLLDGQSALAELLDISPGAVNQWVRGVRPVPARHCPAIEQETKGVVTRKDLRPSDWQRYWPELAEAPTGPAPKTSSKGKS